MVMSLMSLWKSQVSIKSHCWDTLVIVLVLVVILVVVFVLVIVVVVIVMVAVGDNVLDVLLKTPGLYQIPKLKNWTWDIFKKCNKNNQICPTKLKNASNFTPSAFYRFWRGTKKMSFFKFSYIKDQFLRKVPRSAHIYVRDSLSFQKIVFFDDLGLKFLRKKITSLSLFNWQFKNIMG